MGIGTKLNATDLMVEKLIRIYILIKFLPEVVKKLSHRLAVSNYHRPTLLNQLKISDTFAHGTPV